MHQHFPHPTAKLSTLSVLPGPAVTKQPQGGNAPTLDPAGKLPPAAAGVVRGQVDASGNILAGDGFTIVHAGTGGYTVAFDPGAFSGPPTIVPGSTQANRLAVALSVTSTGFTMSVGNASTTAAADGSFNFIAYA